MTSEMEHTLKEKGQSPFREVETSRALVSTLSEERKLEIKSFIRQAAQVLVYGEDRV